MLTQAQVKALTAPGKYLDQHGLYLVVTTPEKRYWQFRYASPITGKDRMMSFGRVGPITLEGARVLHLDAQRQIKQGIDPLDAKHAAKAPQDTPPAVPTFADVAKLFIAAHEAGWRNPIHRQQWRNTLATYADPVIGDKPVDAIDVNDILAVLQPLWEAKKLETGSRVRGRIEMVLSYAKTRGWRSGENPAAWRDNLKLLLPAKGKVRAVKHHAAMDWRDAPAFMAKLLDRDAGMGARALAFAILTAARSGEVRGAQWSEIDPVAGLWTVPGARMKAGRSHRVPLSAPVLDLLSALADLRQGSLVFPGPRDPETPLSDMTLTAVLKRMGLAHLTAHGFRSTFRDWCADTGKPADAAEAALAHTPGSKVVAAYQRSDLLDQRRPLMTEWADFLNQPPATVLPFPKVA
jgi:integrase